MERAIKLSPSEAGFVLNRSPRAVNKAVDTGFINRGSRRRGSTKRQLGLAELRFLKLEERLHKHHLTPVARDKLYRSLRNGLSRKAGRLDLGPLKVDLTELDREIEPRLRRLRRLKELVEQRSGKEPVIRGTEISVHVIAGLGRGQTVEEILEDYPRLSRAQVESAIEYAQAYPKRGRPYPARSFRRMLRDLRLHELELERTQEGPRIIKL